MYSRGQWEKNSSDYEINTSPVEGLLILKGQLSQQLSQQICSIFLLQHSGNTTKQCWSYRYCIKTKLYTNSCILNLALWGPDVLLKLHYSTPLCGPMKLLSWSEKVIQINFSYIIDLLLCFLSLQDVFSAGKRCRVKGAYIRFEHSVWTCTHLLWRVKWLYFFFSF